MMMARDTPVGGVIMYVGSIAPPGWLMCDGAAVPRGHEYDDLAHLLGTRFNPNPGTGAIHVPDLRARMIVGADQARPDRQVGHQGGAETVTLSLAEMPHHDHGGKTKSGNPVFHRVVHQAGDHCCENHVQGWAGGAYHDVTSSDYPQASHTHNIQAEGGGAAHENMPPFMALNYIIRATQ
eukprot:TRINITY_DN34314_c0_g1_i1.p1 TRINITY_DN34314_c0_g1~~TRINITY_DN34314_c0_g1_i1.p1  ORF type:complete len:180 (-),score=20.55 TRINITY_DN34314_c0_g1_i1:244-783(-)